MILTMLKKHAYVKTKTTMNLEKLKQLIWLMVFLYYISYCYDNVFHATNNQGKKSFTYFFFYDSLHCERKKWGFSEAI